MDHAAHRRHDISDHAWSLIEPHLPGQRGQWGGIAHDNRRFINTIFWILRTGAPWRDLPPDFEWLMIDASHCKVHPDEADAEGGNQQMSRTKGGSTQNYILPWMRMACRSELLLQKVQTQIAKKLSDS